MTFDPVSQDVKLTVVRGENKTLRVTISDKNGLVDLTGATLYFTVRKRVEDPIALISKTSASVLQIQILSPQSDADKKGRADVFIIPEDTSKSMKPGSYVFDMWVQLSSSKRYRIVKTSTFIVEAGVTVIE